MEPGKEVSAQDGLLTPGQVSLLLQIPKSTLAVWRSTGRVKLPFVKIGRAVRYRLADVEHLISAGEGTP